MNLNLTAREDINLNTATGNIVFNAPVIFAASDDLTLQEIKTINRESLTSGDLLCWSGSDWSSSSITGQITINNLKYTTANVGNSYYKNEEYLINSTIYSNGTTPVNLFSISIGINEVIFVECSVMCINQDSINNTTNVYRAVGGLRGNNNDEYTLLPASYQILIQEDEDIGGILFTNDGSSFALSGTGKLDNNFIWRVKVSYILSYFID